jgi:glycosyltransferase involved in cell wall biosynthesis
MMLVFLLVSLNQIRKHEVMYANWVGAGIVGAMINLLTGKPMVLSPLGDDGYLARDRRLWRILTKWVCSRASVVAPNSVELTQIFEDLGIARDKFYFYRMGVDTELFHPAADMRTDGHEVQVVFVGSLIERKGPQDLLKAVADDSLEQVQLVIVGDGKYRTELEMMAEELGLVHRIQWKGMVSPSEEAEILRESDIFCMPSYMEGTPNVVYEAMAVGLPVVSTRVGGIPDQVAEGKTGLLCDAGNVEQLRQCLTRLVQQPDLRRKMGRAGHERIIDSKLSWDGSAEEFDKIFSDLAGRDHG